MPATQDATRSEGMALGLWMHDRHRFRHKKLRVDLAFGARGGSGRSSRFSQVDTDLGTGMGGTLVMTRAEKAKHTFVFSFGTMTVGASACAQQVGARTPRAACAKHKKSRRSDAKQPTSRSKSYSTRSRQTFPLASTPTDRKWRKSSPK